MASEVRQKKVAERLKEEIASILLSEIKDPRIGMISVVRVKLSPDLRDAAVFVSVLGDAAAKKTSMSGLRHARGFIQTLVSKRLELRFSPIIKFRLDESIENAIRVTKIIDDIAAERKAREGSAGIPEKTGDEKGAGSGGGDEEEEDDDEVKDPGDDEEEDDEEEDDEDEDDEDDDDEDDEDDDEQDDEDDGL